jgi:hypothetical protein
MKLTLLNAILIIGLCGVLYSNDSRASNTDALDQALDDISGMADSNISVGGNLTSTCVTSSNAVCIGTYVWTDDHSNDQSVNKGALVLSGNVQQNVTSTINVTSDTSPTATGVNTIGTITVPVPGTTLNFSNNNNATGLIGGF